jgi:UDP-N-acetyl-D-mannosaminuronate dehydrogenase
VTYKPNIADERESPAAPLGRQLIAQGATVRFHDPKVTVWRALGADVTRVEDPATAAATADLTILVQNHREYDVDALAAAAQRFLDTRGVVTEGERIERL